MRSRVRRDPRQRSASHPGRHRSIDSLEAKGASPQYIDDLRHILEYESQHAFENMQTQTHYLPVSEMVRNELEGSPISSFTKNEQFFDHPLRTAMYDQALRRLAHADFNLQPALQSRVLNRRP